MYSSFSEIPRISRNFDEKLLKKSQTAGAQKTAVTDNVFLTSVIKISHKIILNSKITKYDYRCCIGCR
jgi:hypothetical protein